MLWELIATVVAGIGAAGIALALRKLTKGAMPMWLIPAVAGAAMLGFQVYSEYSWFDHQAGLLPKGVVVVRKVEQQAVWRPWSYLYPQTLRFIAADVANAASNQINPEIKLVDLYFFERRSAAKRVTQVLHCAQHARADFSQALQIPAQGESLNSDWQQLDSTDPLFLAVCQS